MKRQFGRYVIEDDVADELGRGAFGRVYRARDPNVNRYVAVKVLSSGSDPDILNRFKDETETTANLRHANIVEVYDFDLQDGMPYLVMELLEGETLEAVIRSRMAFNRPIQLLDEVEIMFQVASGLQYAHARNVIHRDIKPGNIMVLPNGNVKVMDFGIARMMDKAGTRRTRQGDIAGTILYMAPEQFKGGDADKRTDIFSYAGVYYELITGEHPFFATDPGTVMYRITAHDPPPVRERIPECPALLEAMIQRLMVKDREIRADRLEEVILDTQPILQGLRQEKAADMVAAIPALIEAGDEESARQAIRQVLELDPLNFVARSLRDRLQDEYRRNTIRTRVGALTREGEDHVSARRFGDAVQCFERAYALDRSDGWVQARLGEVKLLCEMVRKAARLLGEARAELQKGRLEAALEKSEQALVLDAQNQDVVQFGSEVRRQIRDRRDADALLRATEHRRRGEYAESLAILDGIEDGSAAKIEAVLLRGMVERDRVEAEIRHRRELFEAAVSGIRELLASHRLDEANVSAEALSSEYPDEPAAADLLSEVREHLAARGRMAAVGKITQAARGLVNEERFSDARGVIEEGLHAYPGDTTLTRLLQVAAALAAAQERADQISHIVERTYSLSADGRLDEALLAIDGAIKKFGNEIALAERKRDLEFERARAEYDAGLRKTLEDARCLVASGRPGEAVELLEEAKFRFPGESDIANLRDEARAAQAAEEEREFVGRTLSEVAALELAEQFGAAMSLVDSALAQYPSNGDLPSAAGRLRQKLEEQGRRRMLASRIGRIEAAIQSGDWDRAAAEYEDAGRIFPVEEALALFAVNIQDGKRQAEIRLLQGRVEASLTRQDLGDAEGQLAAAIESFPQETVWQDLRRDCLRLRQYLDSLATAENARNRKQYALAEQILSPMVADALDGRAGSLLGEVIAARRAEEEETRRREEDRIHRQEEAARRKRERMAIAKARAEAAALARKTDYLAAIAILEPLAGQYAGAIEIQQDLDAAKLGLEQQRREAEDEARRLRQQTITARRKEAAELLGNGDSSGAIALLDQLVAEFPDVAEIRQDREAIARELERRRREAAEQIRLAREQTIAARRNEAAELHRNGDSSGAIALLDRWGAEFPDAAEIRQDREAIVRECERQRREAEEQARLVREQAIAARREEAAELLRSGDLQGSAAILDQLRLEFPEVIEIRRDREAIVREEERQRREAAEQARRLREQAVAAGRLESAELLRNGDAAGAIAILDRLEAEYPDLPEIRRDRKAAARAEEKQRQEAEERLRRQREREAIDAGLARAAGLVRQGNHSSAVALLDQLATQYPGNPEIQRERNTARREWERQQREAEEETRHLREQAIALRRQEAADCLRKGETQEAIAILDRLNAEYPDSTEIRRDREAAVNEQDRRQREFEEQARRQREREATEEGRARAAILVRQGSHQSAIALLDQLATQYPHDPSIREDRETAWRDWENLRRAAEEQARRERELAELAQGRNEAAELMRSGNYQAALAVLDRLALRFPDNPEIEQDRKSASGALDRQHFEAEERARRALADVSSRRRENGAPAESAQHPRRQISKPIRKPYPKAGPGAEDSSTASSRRGSTGVGRGTGEARIGATTRGRSGTGGETGYQVFTAASQSQSGGKSAAASVPGSALGRLYSLTGHAILTLRNAIAAFLGKGDRSVIVPVLDPSAAAALGWFSRRHPEDLALLTARDELARRPGRSPASQERLIALAAGLAVVILLSAYFGCRPSHVPVHAPPASVKTSQTTGAVPSGR